MVFGPLPEWQNWFSPNESDLLQKFNVLFRQQRMRAEAPIYFTPQDGIPRRTQHSANGKALFQVFYLRRIGIVGRQTMYFKRPNGSEMNELISRK